MTHPAYSSSCCSAPATCKGEHCTSTHYFPAEVIGDVAPPVPELAGGASLLEQLARVLIGARGFASPLPIADAMFGAPSWFVPATLAAVAAGVVAGVAHFQGRGPFTSSRRAPMRKKRARR